MSAITPADIRARRQDGIAHVYSERDTLLYALAVGMGRDPLDRTELDFVWERRGTLRAMPSMAVALASHNLIFDIGLDLTRMVQAEQELVLHQPLPAAGELVADHRVLEVYDKGAGKGLMIRTHSAVRLRGGALLYEVFNLHYARGDGGCGGSSAAPPTLPAVPDRMPDVVRHTPTLPNQALLYHLVGDRTDVHGDPDVAQRAGFRGPILHGPCVLGMACRDVLAGALGYDVTRLRSLAARFTAVVYPGEELETDLWIAPDQVAFRVCCPARGVTVLDRGRCRITGPGA